MTYPKTMYRVKQYGFGIETVEVVKESKKCVWLQDYTWRSPPTPIPGKYHRELKTKHNQFFETFGEAKESLVSICRDGVAFCEKDLVNRKQRLEDAKSMMEAAC